MDRSELDCGQRQNGGKFIRRRCFLLICLVLVTFSSGCTILPKRLHQPKLYNPFPQLHKIAVVPFFNQSNFPSINGAKVAMNYRHQLQQVRGFEVVPVGVVDQFLKENPIPINSVPNFQLLAKQLGVDAVVVGSITDFDPYYPPKMGLAVRWYAANECLHPIPPGYGLPWGTSEEEFIPEYLRYEAEFSLAQKQLQTQTPKPGTQAPEQQGPAGRHASIGNPVPGMSNPNKPVGVNYPLPGIQAGYSSPSGSVATPSMIGSSGTQAGRWQSPPNAGLPKNWPDSNAYIPDGPRTSAPKCDPQSGPIMSLIKQYDGADSEFTGSLAKYYQFQDDKRFGGWESYLQRQDDFIDFCCYLHISELLSARGGSGKSKVVWKWPFEPYEEP